MRRTLPGLLAACVSACGGGSPPPATAEPAPAPAGPAAPAPAASTPPAADAPPAATDTAAPAPAEAPVASKQPMSDVLTAPNVAFVLNYANSGAKAVAERKCEKVGDDPAARAACTEKERGKFLADVLLFSKDKDGKGASWTIFRRDKNSLLEVSKSQIEFADDTPASVKVKVKSEKGWRPLFAGKKELVVTSGEYAIELEDPQYGKLVYEARIGLVDRGQ